MLVFLAALLAVVSQAEVKLYEYERSEGACRMPRGQPQEKNAGLVFFRDRDCQSRCNSQTSCTGYVLPKSNSVWCETYTSKGASGDGRNFWCYMKGGEKEKPPPSAYRETTGACRKGEQPQNNAGLKFFSNRGCEARCEADPNCTGYVLPVRDDKNWCETYTSPGASGDGRVQFKCFMKMVNDKLQNVCAPGEDGKKTCQCYKGYDFTCRAITTGAQDCKKANCKFVDGKCKGHPKGKRMKCKKAKWTSKGGFSMCSCLPGCTVTKKTVRQRVRRRRANKQPKANFKCQGDSFKFD